MKKTILTNLLCSFVLLFIFFPVHAQLAVNTDQANGKTFDLKNADGILVDDEDNITVKTAAKLFAKDIKRVTDKEVKITGKNKIGRSSAEVVIVGTIEKNRIIQKLNKKGLINADSLKGEWERYAVQVVKDPLPGVEKALVVVGSDRRGAAYGLLSISELIGVSPWYWWADVPVAHKDNLKLSVKSFLSKAPSVKYRGIFINDEDWGILRWAKRTFDKELNDIGPKTYRKVFELLLRLKANHLLPAMHGASGPFNKYPENKYVADTFGIVMGSAHPEPLLFNNASEWNEKKQGPWNYVTNKENILKALDKRVKNNAPFENIYTVGMRGIHDKAMEGDYPIEKRVKILENAIDDERDLLKKHIDKPIEEIPQAFTPYKEVLELYDAGLDLPDDVTIVWPDDNYGYMKRLSNKKEQQRSGHSGVYYHASYLGSPHDYLWISSTPPNLMYEELKKAYDTGADRIWILNSGDIKSTEYPIMQFLSMAWDMDKFDFENTPKFRAKWLSDIYGDQYYDDLLNITTTYDHLAFSRKPEFMGWGYEWNTHKHGRERTTDTDFSFSNYREAEKRLNQYEKIADRSYKIMQSLPEKQKSSFYQLLYYPVKGAELMNKMHLIAQKNRWYASQGRAKTNELAAKTHQYHDSLRIITKKYNGLSNGKWEHVMSMVQGVTASYFELPKVDSLKLPVKSEMGLFVQNSGGLRGVNSHALPVFNALTKQKYFIDVFNKGKKRLKWKIKKSPDWLIINKKRGKTNFKNRVWVSVDWNKIPDKENLTGEVVFSANNNEARVNLSVFNPKDIGKDDLKGYFIEDNGYVSIPGAEFTRKKESKDIKVQLINDLGVEGKSAMLGDPTKAVINPKRSDAPYLEYDFYTFNYGSVDVYVYALPVFPLSSNRDFGFHESSTDEAKYAVSIDEGPISTPSPSANEYSQKWSENVLRNFDISKSTLHINHPGKHSLRINMADPGMVIQKIVIDFGGVKRSYLGPPPSTKIGETAVNTSDK